MTSSEDLMTGSIIARMCAGEIAWWDKKPERFRVRPLFYNRLLSQELSGVP